MVGPLTAGKEKWRSFSRDHLSPKSRVSLSVKLQCCNICGENVINNKDLKSHIEDVHKTTDGDFACPYCSKKYDIQKQLYIHIREKHEVTKNCGLCHYSTTGSIDNHYNDVHTKNNRWICDLCGGNKTFADKRSFIKHLNNEHRHDNNEKKLVCSRIDEDGYCLLEFDREDALLNHINTVHGFEDSEQPFLS